MNISTKYFLHLLVFRINIPSTFPYKVLLIFKVMIVHETLHILLFVIVENNLFNSIHSHQVSFFTTTIYTDKDRKKPRIRHWIPNFICSTFSSYFIVAFWIQQRTFSRSTFHTTYYCIACRLPSHFIGFGTANKMNKQHSVPISYIHLFSIFHSIGWKYFEKTDSSGFWFNFGILAVRIRTLICNYKSVSRKFGIFWNIFRCVFHRNMSPKTQTLNRLVNIDTTQSVATTLARNTWLCIARTTSTYFISVLGSSIGMYKIYCAATYIMFESIQSKCWEHRQLERILNRMTPKKCHFVLHAVVVNTSVACVHA